MLITGAFIYYTVKACKNGWGGRGLLPMGIVYATCFMLGVLEGLSGSDGTALMGLGVILEIGGLITARVMSRNAPAESVSVTREPIPSTSA